MWQYHRHRVWGGGEPPQPARQRLSATIQYKVKLPHTMPDEGSFDFISYILIDLFHFKLNIFEKE